MTIKALAFDTGGTILDWHNFDLDAARGCGFQTAFVRRPDEWGAAGPPDPNPNPACTYVVDGFEDLAERLGALRA